MHKKTMAQRVVSVTIPAGHQRILIAKPTSLYRIFFSVRALADDTAWYKSKISLGDPLFASYYVLDGPAKYFEARGVGVFQGNVWVRNVSTTNLLYSATDILININNIKHFVNENK